MITYIYIVQTITNHQTTAHTTWTSPANTRRRNDRNNICTFLRAKKQLLSAIRHLRLNGRHTLDFLIENGVEVIKIFGPEHGFRDMADDATPVVDKTDVQTGLPVISLYGAVEKPTPEHLKDIEVFVYDIQDVGVRFYTYISTLSYIMEAAGENDIPVVVLDRPNPTRITSTATYWTPSSHLSWAATRCR